MNNDRVVKVYAHRGMRELLPESTLEGYAECVKYGVDKVDMDIGISQDGVIVVTHDVWLNPDIVKKGDQYLEGASCKKDMLDKLSEQGDIDDTIQPYLIKNHTVSRLKQYNVGSINPKSPYKKYFVNQKQLIEAQIPTLQEVIDLVNLQTSGEVGFNLEIKNDVNNRNWTVSNKEFAKLVYDIIVHNDLIDRVDVQAFDWNVLIELNKLDKNIRTSFLVAYDSLDSAYTAGYSIENYTSIPQMIKSLGGYIYGPEDVMLTKEDLEEAHSLGLEVEVWRWPEHSGSMYDDELLEKLITWGLDIAISDDVRRVNKILAKLGLPLPKKYI